MTNNNINYIHKDMTETRYLLRIQEDEKDFILDAANHRGLTLAAFIRSLCLKEAEQILGERFVDWKDRNDKNKD